MLGLVKRNEILEVLEQEIRLNKRLMDVNSRLALTADNDAERLNYQNLSEEYQHRYDESMTILNKIKQRI